MIAPVAITTGAVKAVTAVTAIAAAAAAVQTGVAVPGALPAVPAAEAAAEPGPTTGEIAAQFGIWNDALRSRDPVRVAGLYAPDAVLLPTMSSQVRDSRAEIADYFAHFLELRPLGTVTESHVRILDRDTALHSGRYRFDLLEIGPGGGPNTVDARFTFVYEKRGARWLIVEHHSSKAPK